MFLRLVIPNVAHCRLTAGAIRAIAWLSWRRGLLPMMVLNTELLLFLDAPGHSKEVLLAIAKLLSDGPVVVVPLVLACLWIWGRPEGRSPHLAAVRKLIVHAASSGLSPLEFAN
jgi:hypothetical protein